MIQSLNRGQVYRFVNGMGAAVLPNNERKAMLAIFYYRKDCPLWFGPLSADQVIESLADIQRMPIISSKLKQFLINDPPEYPHDKPAATWLGSMNLTREPFQRFDLWWHDNDAVIRWGSTSMDNMKAKDGPNHPAVLMARSRHYLYYGGCIDD